MFLTIIKEDEFDEAVGRSHWRRCGEVDIEKFEDRSEQCWSVRAAVDLYRVPREIRGEKGTRRSWHWRSITME